MCQDKWPNIRQFLSPETGMATLHFRPHQMAIAIKGIKCKDVEHKISLYVDDVLLFLQNSQTNLSEVITLINQHFLYWTVFFNHRIIIKASLWENRQGSIHFHAENRKSNNPTIQRGFFVITLLVLITEIRRKAQSCSVTNELPLLYFYYYSVKATGWILFQFLCRADY